MTGVLLVLSIVCFGMGYSLGQQNGFLDGMSKYDEQVDKMAVSRRKMVSWDKSTTSRLRRRIYDEAMDIGYMPNELTITAEESELLQVENKRIIKRLQGVLIVRET